MPDAKELTEELAFLAGSLQSAELERALKILDAKKEKPSAALAFPLLRRRQAELIINGATDHFERRRDDLMDAEMKKVEAFASQLPGLSDDQ